MRLLLQNGVVCLPINHGRCKSQVNAAHRLMDSDTREFLLLLMILRTYIYERKKAFPWRNTFL